MKNLSKFRPLSSSLSPTLFRTLTTSPSFSLKNVTNSNFQQTLTDLTTHVKAADFIAVDLEMTGITSSPWRESFELDRYDVRYLKVKDSAQKFAVVQFGVCPFRWDPLQLSFIAHPHNFYIFPRQELPSDGPSCEFTCQTSSVDFLAKYQFDFNACIREGISYLSRGQEDLALSRLKSLYSEKWHHSEEVRDIPLANVADILFSERMRIRLNEWHDSLLQNKKANLHVHANAVESKQQFDTIFFGMRPALRLSGFTSHQLEIIELVTRKHFKDLVFVRACGEESVLQKLIVYVDSDFDKAKLMNEVKNGLHQQASRKVKAAVGFRHVIDLLSAEKKPIVGHNCFLDMAHMHQKFFGPLPSTVEEFVSNIHQSYPCIFDTKVLLNSDSALQQLMMKANTSLASAFSKLCPEIASQTSSDSEVHPCVKVEVQVDDMRSSNWNSGASHEAGYDAFMTGCVFAQCCSHLGVEFPARNLASSEELLKYANLLYLSWNSGDMINLSTGDIAEVPIVSTTKRRYANTLHKNTILIWGYPPKLQASEIRKCLCKVFGLHSVVFICNLDETAVFVQFSRTELVTDFFALKERLESSDDSVSVLHPFSKLLEGGKTCAAGYEFYREICSSPISMVLFAEQAEAMGINWKTQVTESYGISEGLSSEPSSEEISESNPLSEIRKTTKLKKNVEKNTSDRSIFSKLFFASDSESSREKKLTSSCNS